MDLPAAKCLACSGPLGDSRRQCPYCGVDVLTAATATESVALATDSDHRAARVESAIPGKVSGGMYLVSGNRVAVFGRDIVIRDPNEAPLMTIDMVSIMEIHRYLFTMTIRRSRSDDVELTFVNAADGARLEGMIRRHRPNLGNGVASTIGNNSGSSSITWHMAISIILGLSLLGGVIVWIADSGSDSSSTDEAASRSNATTATRTPTRVTSATRTPTRAASSMSESRYRSEIGSQLSTMGSSMGRFSQLAGTPQLLSNSWKLDVAVELAIWQQSYREARQMDPPTGFEAFHRKYVSALAKFDSAATDAAAGIDDVDSSRLESANRKISEGRVLLQDAEDLMPD